MDTLNTLLLLSFFTIGLLILVVIIFGIVAIRQVSKMKEQQKRINKLSSVIKGIQQTQNASLRKEIAVEHTAKSNRQSTIIVEEPSVLQHEVYMPSSPENTAIEITEQFRQALKIFDSNFPCVFITGKAGTGKSELLKYFLKHTKKSVIVLAPTGMAALRVEGQTLHSFFGFPGRTLTDDDIKLSTRTEVYKAIDTIVIDEISMVRADFLDRIDQFLRLNGRDSAKPFGGAQMIFFGDLYQLPPIVSEEEESQFMAVNYQSVFFFDAQVMKQIPFTALELTKVYRQKDIEFIKALDAIRIDSINSTTLQTINQCVGHPRRYTDKNFITLTVTNPVADNINKTELKKLPTQQFSYQGILEGEFATKQNRKRTPVDEILELKVGAQVIFVKNDSSKRWLNGDMGKVVELDENHIRVEMDRDDKKFEYDVDRETWEIFKYTFDYETGKIAPKTIGKYVQYPLRLGWAITIHKSQGATLERVHINFGNGAFAAGQTYVALSRCKSLAGITLEKPVGIADIKSDPKIKRFMKTILFKGPEPKSERVELNKEASRTDKSDKKPASSKGSIANIDEEHKYTERRTGKPEWYATAGARMILPLHGDKTRGVDLGIFPGRCKIYVEGQYAWTSTVVDIMSAQALWQAAKKHCEITIEPEIACQIISVINH